MQFKLIGQTQKHQQFKEFDSLLSKNLSNKMEMFQQYEKNPISTAQMSEWEMILETERKKAKEIRDRIESELEQERRTRVEIENRFIKLKDETLKREMLLSELDFKICNLAQENNSLTTENFSIKEEIQKLTSQFEARLRDVDDKLAQAQKQCELIEEHYKQEQQKMDMRFKNQYEEAMKEWETRVRQYDENLQKVQQNKNRLEQEMKEIQDRIIKFKYEAQEEMREMQIRVQNEEHLKYQSNLKMVEDKLRSSEENRDNLARKNQELVKQLQEKDRRIHEDFFRFENETGSLKHELSDLKNQFNQADILINKLRQELSQKDLLTARNNADISELNKQLQQSRNEFRQEIEKQMQEHQQQIQNLNELRNSFERKNIDLEAQLSEKNKDLLNVKNEYDRLVNQLKSNINQTIFQTISEVGEKFNIDTQKPSQLYRSNLKLGVGINQKINSPNTSYFKALYDQNYQENSYTPVGQPTLNQSNYINKY